MILIMAWRNIWRNKMRSVIIILSITVGLFAGVAVLALYNGMMRSRIRAVIETEVGHLQLHDSNFKKDYEPKYIISNGNEVIRKLATISGIRCAAPRSITSGMLATATGSAGVQIIGVVPALEYEISQLKNKIIEGSVFDTTAKNEVMIGEKLAAKLKIKLRSKLVITFTDSSGNIVSAAFKVAAVYRSDNAPLDERNVYITINEMNALLTTGSAFHEIALLLNDDNAVESIQQQIRQLFPSLITESWKEISPETDLMVKTTNQYSYIIMVIIMLALMFGIINTMLMAILERTREIGMMMALGTNKMKLFILILLETIFLTLAGTPVGILTGWLLTDYYNRNGLDLSGMGRDMMSSFGFSTMIYPEFPDEKLTAVMLIVFCTAVIASLLPALKALKLKPVEALRR